MAGVQEGGVHAHREPSLQALGGPDQLQPQAELAGVLHVVALQLLDALVADLVEAHGRPEGQARQDRHLGRRVAAVDVLARIGLGVAQPLGLGQRLLVGESARHLGEDEVGGAVDDAVDAIDVGGGERLGQHADDWHHAGHGRLEAQLDAMLAGGAEQLVAVLGQELLVGGDHRAPGAHRAQDVFARGLDTAHQLDDQLGLLEDLLEVAAAAREHAGEQRPAAGELLDMVRALLEQASERSADRAVAEQPDAKGGHAPRGPRRTRVARPRARCRRRRRRPGGRGTRCSCWPARVRRPRWRA